MILDVGGRWVLATTLGLQRTMRVITYTRTDAPLLMQRLGRRLLGGRHRLLSTAIATPIASTTTKPRVNSLHEPDPHAPPSLNQKPNQFDASTISEAHWDDASWSTEDIRAAQHKHVVATWGPTNAIADAPILERGEHIYLYDRDGKQYIDWTSQAVCTNLGYDVPPAVVSAVTKQLTDLPMAYGGLGITEVRCRMAELMSQILPGDINGFVFPTGGAEATEAAVRIARRYTNKQKILTHYRSYHGGTATALAATGDFRRWWAEAGATGFVKAYNPTPLKFSWGASEEEASSVALAALEEQILYEGPSTIAAILMESIIGSGGAVAHPEGYVQGVRALCDKYEILYIADEVMVGFGRTGKLWGFQHYDGVVPDLVTSAKGLSGAYLPLSVVGMREPIRQFFLDKPLAWGATYQAHPVSLACAYECVKHMIAHDLPGNAAKLQPVMVECMQQIVDDHPTVRQGRALGLFGCLDLIDPSSGEYIQQLHTPSPPAVNAFKKAMREEGVYGLLRPPFVHCAPPLVINEEELRDGFARVDRALDVLDEEVKRGE